MKIFKVSVAGSVGYDQYDAAIVIAKDADDARKVIQEHIEAYENRTFDINETWISSSSWGEDPSKSNVEKIGAASSNFKRGDIILASFNAG